MRSRASRTQHRSAARFRRLWARLWYGDGKPQTTCPVCGRGVNAIPNTVAGPVGPLSMPRPVGELEALCHQQNGTDHQVPIHW